MTNERMEGLARRIDRAVRAADVHWVRDVRGWTMSEIKALNELRELVSDINAKEIVDHMQLYPSAVFDCMWLDSWHSEFNRLVESLEAEIADSYMLLPVDADGVPIRPGDVVATEFSKNKTVWMVSNNGFAVYGDAGGYNPKAFSHVKLRTLEDVLIEYRLKAYNLYLDDEMTGDERVDEFKKLDAEYDSEIRELFGGDAE